jgi:C4-type Zn-finger protein
MLAKSEETLTESLKCPLCGAGLTGAKSACASCPLHGGCNMLCCENCGYQFLDTKKKKKKHEHSFELFKRKIGI